MMMVMALSRRLVLGRRSHERLVRSLLYSKRFFSVLDDTTTTTTAKEHCQQQRQVTIAVARETYDKWERRAPLTPHHVGQLIRDCRQSQLRVIVQPSSQRIHADRLYAEQGATLSEDLSEADIILGVKRPKDPSTMLLPNKTYVFFSHVAKGQPENMGLLQDCLSKRVQLMDYERIVVANDNDNNNKQQHGKKGKRRLVSFGRYAGMAGAMDSFHALGRRLLYRDDGSSTPFLSFPTAWQHDSLKDAKDRVLRMGERLSCEGIDCCDEPLVFAVTGKGGCVHSGAMEILQLLPHKVIGVNDLPELFQSESTGPQYKIHVVPVGKEDIFQRRNGDGGSFDRDDFQQHPADYRSLFAKRVAPFAQVIVNCVYWDARFPRLLTKQQMRRLYEDGNRRLLLVSDISCDVNGSIEFLERTTTIEKPFFQYDPIAEKEVADEISDEGVTVMGVDILPTELPRESSEHFGNAVIGVVKELVATKQRQDAAVEGIDTSLLSSQLADACITTIDGKLERHFRYLHTLMNRAPRPAPPANKTMIISLEGHLFDSGLINQILDVIEHRGCGLSFEECLFPPHAVGETKKSSVVLKISGHDESTLVLVESKIKSLVGAIEKAKATMTRMDRRRTEDGIGSGGVHVEDPKMKKRVLLLGAGRVAKSLVDLLGRTSDVEITVASEREEEARTVAAAAPMGRHVAVDVANDLYRLSGYIEDSDLVVSLLPAPMHPSVALECILHKKDLVTASYESEEIRKMHERARDAGIVILNEVGLDPGLDHMSAMKIIDEIEARGGMVTGFTSVCGGLPAPEAADNPLRYKVSWSPIMLIRASLSGARYRWESRVMEVQKGQLLQSASPFLEWPDLELECLPNRDSLQYERAYGIDGVQTLFRGTLRYRGFSSLMNVFQNMGLFDSICTDAETWNELIHALRLRRGGFDSVDDFILACADEDHDEADRAVEALIWLGILSGTAAPKSSNVVEAFCGILEDRLGYDENERDMVIMQHRVDASFEDGTVENHNATLRVFGDHSMSAMSKTVGYTTAAAAGLILDGSLQAEKGLLLPTRQDIYLPVLSLVKQEGISFDENVSVHSSTLAQETMSSQMF